MKRLKSRYLPLVAILIGGILLGSLAADGLALGKGIASHFVSLNTSVNGTLAGCLGNNTSSAGVTLGGRALPPNTILRISPTGTCQANESNLNLFGYANTVLVSVGADPVANGAALQSAMTAISNTGASANRTFLVKLEPGTYDLGNGTLNMLPYVDLEGSGEDVTLLTAQGQGGALFGTVVGAKNSEVRSLTVQSRGANNFNIGIYTAPGLDKTFKVKNVTVNVSGSSNSNTGLFLLGSAPTIQNCTVNIDATSGNAYGFNTSGSNLTIEGCKININSQTSTNSVGVYTDQTSNLLLQNLNVTISATNTINAAAVQINSSTSSATIRNANISVNNSNPGNPNAGSYGVLTIGTAHIQGSQFNVQYPSGGAGIQLLQNGGRLYLDSSIVTTNGAAVVTGVNTPANIGTSQLIGLGTVIGNTTPVCVASYNASYAPLSSSCA